MKMEIEEPKEKKRPPMTRDEIKKMFPRYVKLRAQGCGRFACMNPDCAKYPGKITPIPNVIKLMDPIL